MTSSSASTLSSAIRRRIARRLALAHWSKVAIVPTAAIAIYLGPRSHWFAYTSVALFVVEVLVIMVGEAQRCPLCDASLLIRQRWQHDLATECPECGFVVD